MDPGDLCSAQPILMMLSVTNFCLCFRTWNDEREETCLTRWAQLSWRRNITYDVSLLPVASPTSLQLPSEDQSVAIPFSRLSNLQEQDNILVRVINYVLRRKRLSKSERAKEPRSVTYLLKHWKKLKIRNHVLYRVKRDRLMNRKLLQYVVHDSLKHDILRGVHDAAGHQGSARTLFLAAERFFWPGMKKTLSCM